MRNAKKTSEEEYYKMIEGDRKPQIGDLIYSRNATVGESTFVNTNERFCMGQDVCLIRSIKQNQLYLNYLLRSSFLKDQLNVTMVGSTFKRINVQSIKDFRVTIPPIDEQASIAKFLLEYDKRWNDGLLQIEKEIDLLIQLKQSIVSEAVTGKIDVRDWQPNTKQVA